MRIARSMISILAPLSIAGCMGTAWPPHSEQAREHFNLHRAEFDELAGFMREQDLWTISQSAVRPPAVGFRTPKSQFENALTPGQAEYVASLLSSAQVAGVTRVDSILYFETGEGRIEPSDYIYGYIDAEPGSKPPELCSSLKRPAANGECRVPLSGSWSINYWWNPARSRGAGS